MTGNGGPDLPEDIYSVLYSDKQNAQAIYEQRAAAWRRKNAEKDRAAMREMRLWIEKLMQTNGLPNQRDFLYLAAAHLNFLEGNYLTAKTLVNSISSTAGPRLQQQRRVEQILLSPHTQNLQNITVQENLLQLIRQFWFNRQYTEHPSEQMSRLNFYLCQAYFQAGNIPVAGLFYNKAWLTANESRTHQYDDTATGATNFFEAHATVADLDKLISWRKNGPSGDFERYLLEKPAPVEGRLYDDYGADYVMSDSMGEPLPSLNDLLATQGSIAFRDGDLARSKSCWEQLPIDYWPTYDFVDQDIFADADHFPFERTDSMPSTKLQIVKRMLDLEQESHQATGRRLAEIYYQLGNAWYNCSYWGRTWFMFSDGRSLSDDDRPQVRTVGSFPATPDVHKYGATYYRFDRALAWYRRALAANPSLELAARIEYMLADCDRYMRIMHSGTDNYYYSYNDKKLPSSPLFKQWQAHYGQTAAYAERIAHCPELRDYLGVKK